MTRLEDVAPAQMEVKRAVDALINDFYAWTNRPRLTLFGIAENVAAVQSAANVVSYRCEQLLLVLDQLTHRSLQRG